MDDDNVSDDSVFLKDDTKEILRAVFNAEGGVTTTSKIKQQTGLGNQKILYRLTDSADALEDVYGFVSVSDVSEENYYGQGMSPKRVELTEKGREAVEGGVVGDVFDNGEVRDEVEVSREQLESFQEELGRVQNRLNSLVNEGVGEREGVRDELDSLSSRLDEIRGGLDEVREGQREVGEKVDAVIKDMSSVGETVYGDLVPMVAGVIQVLSEEGLDVDGVVESSREDVGGEYGLESFRFVEGDSVDAGDDYE